MTFEIRFTARAVREVRKLDPQTRRRIQAAVELLADNPRLPASTQLVGGSGEWRIRTGDYRIIYEIDDDVLLVLVIRIGHRREVYR